MNFTWNVVQMDRLTSDGFVVTVHYTVNAVDGDFTASTYGTVGFETGTPTTPYASLTKAQVIEWVKDKLGEQATEASLAEQIAAQKNPVTAIGMPWAQA